MQPADRKLTLYRKERNRADRVTVSLLWDGQKRSWIYAVQSGGRAGVKLGLYRRYTLGTADESEAEADFRAICGEFLRMERGGAGRAGLYAWLDEQHGRAGGREVQPIGSATLGDFALWLEGRLATRSTLETTKAAQLKAVRDFAGHVEARRGEDLPLCLLNADDVDAWRQDLAARPPAGRGALPDGRLATSTLNTYSCRVANAFAFALADMDAATLERFLPRSLGVDSGRWYQSLAPSFCPAKPDDDEAEGIDDDDDFFTLDELTAIWAELREREVEAARTAALSKVGRARIGIIRKGEAARIARQVATISVYSGGRIGSIVALRVKHVRWEGAQAEKFGTPHIYFHHAKKKLRYRAAITPPLAEALHEILGDLGRRAEAEGWTITDETPLFPSPHNLLRPRTTNGPSSKFKAAVRAVLGEEETRHFHNLRHAVATLLYNEGVDLHSIAGLLGHTNSMTTERRYARKMPKGTIRAANRVADLIRNL